MSGRDTFPTALLQEASKLDGAQVNACRDALLQEVAVMQGPPGTGKTFLGVKLIQVLLSNTCNEQHVPPRRDGLEPHLEVDLEQLVGRPATRAGGKADVGPILVVCFTNHALDSFLLDILSSGATKSIVRVGGRSSSEALMPFNLANLGSRAGGRIVAHLRQKLEDLGKQADDLQRGLFAAATARALTWDVANKSVLRQVFSGAQCDSFKKGMRPWNFQGKSVDQDGFEDVSRSSATDLLRDWVGKTPAQDWVVGRLDELLPSAGVTQRHRNDVPPHVLHMLFMNRPLEELREVSNVWSMSRQEREVLYEKLQQAMQIDLAGELQRLAKDIDAARKMLQAEYDISSLSALSQARIVGITTSGLAKMQPLIQAVRPRIVLVEEAAEVLEGHILTSLSKYTEHLILIGDHEQLRPKPNLYELQAISGRGYDLDISMFERLVTRSGLQVSRLLTQHRMRPEVSSLIRPVYPDLHDAPRVFTYTHVPGMATDVFFFDHDHKEGGEDADGDGRSKYNTWEAQYAVGLAQYLMLQGIKPVDIVILVPYVGQLFAMRKHLAANNLRMVASERDEEELAQVEAQGDEDAAREDLGNVCTTKEIRVATVDNFQGEEAKVIILSTTRNNKEGNIGFLKMRNRINVMLSRAQWGLYILGNRATLEANADRAPMWSEVLSQLDEKGWVGGEVSVQCQLHGHITPITDVHQWTELVGDGGCQRQCESRLPCGHSCPRRCHVDDLAQHKLVRCVQDCDRVYSHCGHPCPKRCHEPCGQCQRIIKEPITLACGHQISGFKCWRQYTPGELRCTVEVVVEMPECQHSLRVPCFQAQEMLSNPERCTIVIDVVLPHCKHSLKVACGQKQVVLSNPLLCTAKCAAALACSHACTGSCGDCLKRTIQSNQNAFTTDWLRAADEGMVDAWLGSDEAKAQGPNLAQRWLRWLTADGARSSLLRKWLGALEGARQSERVAELAAPAFPAFVQQHHPCQVPCTKQHFCGHECGAPCHHKKPCPPCQKRCGLKCEHSHRPCNQPCSAPCVVCAEKCSWACTHVGMCSAPCGAPCDRLPCNLRCEKLLPCGHRCASVCGEPCNPQLCVETACMALAPEKLKSQTVDMVMLQNFEDMTSESVNEDPLLMLECGHIFTMTSLDGCIGLSSCYVRESEIGPWLAPMPLSGEFQKPPGCPTCRRPIMGVRRYGRAINKGILDVQDRRALNASSLRLQQLQNKIRGIPVTAEPHINVAARIVDSLARNSRKDTIQVLGSALIRAFSVSCDVDKKLRDLATQCNSKSPKQRALEATMARLGRLIDDEAVQQELPQQQQQQQQEQDPEEGQGVRLPMARMDTSDACPAAESAAQAQRTLALQNAAEMASALGPDMGLISRIRAASMEAKEATLNILKTGLELCDRGLVQLEAGNGQRQPPRSAATAAMELRKVTDAQAKKLDAVARWLLQHTPDTATASEPQAWFDAALQARTFSSAHLVAMARLQLTLAVVAALQAKKAAQVLKATGEPGEKHVLELQLQLLDQAEVFGAEAKRSLEGGKVAQKDLISIDEVLAQLPAVKKQISGDAEAEDILSALAAATQTDRARYGYEVDVQSYLSSHLYRCPNGHPYFIGECGQAMQESSCPECGARIGGQGHSLRAGNARADEILQRLRQQQLRQQQP